MKKLRIDKRVVLTCMLAVMAGAMLTACPTTGVTCPNFLAACGQGCADYSNDKDNCGACGIACQSGQVCSQGACQCAPGSQSCGGACVVTANDPQHCGGCAADGGPGAACSPGQVCANGQCATTCGGLNPPNVCGNSCVDFSSDPRNCGSCANACPDKETCHGGKCSFDLVVACFADHGLTGLQDIPGGLPLISPIHLLGAAPEALGFDRNVVLSADGFNKAIYEADATTLVPYVETPAAGSAPNQILVDGAYVYVVNSISNSLQVLQLGGDAGTYATALAGSVDGGLGLGSVAVYALPSNSSPEAAAKLGSNLYIPLFGSDQLAVVNVTNPALPTDAGLIDLRTFASSGGKADPSSVLSHKGSIYVALSNLNPSTFAPMGDGTLVRYSPGDGGLQAIDLGAGCQDTFWLAASPDDSRMYVSCSGATTYDPVTFAASNVANTGVLLFGDNDALLSSWTPQCGGAVDGGCNTFSSARMALRGGRVYLGDNSYGRLVVLDTVQDKLVERVGFQDGGMAALVCPATGPSNVADILNIP